jgi:hypothetical protein
VGTVSLRIEPQVDRWIDDRHQAGIAIRCRIERHSGYRALTRMNRSELRGQHSLMESAITGSEHRSAITRELGRDAETRRPDVPSVDGAKALNDAAGLASFVVARTEVLTRRTVMVEPDASVHRQAIRHSHGLAQEGSRRNKPTSQRCRSARDRLEWLAIVIDEPGPGGQNGQQMVLTLLELSTKLPLMVGGP